MKYFFICFSVIYLSFGKVAAQNWELVWSDEFESAELNTNDWNIEVKGGGFGNQELQYCTDRPENLKIEEGKLIITALREDYYVNNRKAANYTSARINTSRKHDFTYGRIEARAKLPRGAGTWPAFWMLGYGSWPSSGEIDIMEYVGRKPGYISAAIHTKDYNGLNGQQAGREVYVEGVEDDFHIFAIEWTESKIKFFVDDLHYYSYAKSPDNPVNWPFDKPFYIILNMAIGGKMGGAVDNSIFPQRYEVDYVRVYQDKTLGIRETGIDNKVEVSSSPFENELKVKFAPELSGQKNIVLADMSGREVIKSVATDDVVILSTSGLREGIYLLSIGTIGGQYSRKVIKD